MGYQTVAQFTSYPDWVSRGTPPDSLSVNAPGSTIAILHGTHNSESVVVEIGLEAILDSTKQYRITLEEVTP